MDEKEAKKGTEIPANVTTGEVDNTRGKLIAKNEKNTDFFNKYGEPDAFHFFAKVGSDGTFATRVIEDLLGYNETPEAAAVPDRQSPQEDNVTGKLDHTGDVAEKIHVEGENKSEPPVKSKK